MSVSVERFRVFGDPDAKAVEQMENVMRDQRATGGALMADHHLGYSMPIGGVVAYEDAISPTGVGFDIACGNKAVLTNLKLSDFDMSKGRYDVFKPFMREIQKRISFGMGRKNAEPVDHALFDDEVWTEIDRQFGPELKQKARDQLGTVGSGNHYVDLLHDQDGRIWVANHFGSRGLGHTIASGFMAKDAGRDFTDRVPETEDPCVLETHSELGTFYVAAMHLAGRYAYAGRDYVADQVVRILGATPELEIHNHHNFAWFEDGRWVVRKGATPLAVTPAFIGGSMGDVSVIVRGKQFSYEGGWDPDNVEDIGALRSAPHGAGRIMSRTKAAGKFRKMWSCPSRNCSFKPFRAQFGEKGTPYDGNRCPDCGLPLRKRRVRDTSDAAIDWDAVRKQLKDVQEIVVLGAGADEAPGVYKNLMTVLAAHQNIEIVHTLYPIGVVMAGPDEHDPYKD